MRTKLMLSGVALSAAILGLPQAAFAAGSDMPWEGPLEQIVESLTGPVAQALGVLAIVALGFAFAFSEGGSTLRRWLGLPLGITLHAAAVWLTKADPYWFDTFKRQLRCPKHLEA